MVLLDGYLGWLFSFLHRTNYSTREVLPVEESRVYHGSMIVIMRLWSMKMFSSRPRGRHAYYTREGYQVS